MFVWTSKRLYYKMCVYISRFVRAVGLLELSYFLFPCWSGEERKTGFCQFNVISPSCACQLSKMGLFQKVNFKATSSWLGTTKNEALWKHCKIKKFSFQIQSNSLIAIFVRLYNYDLFKMAFIGDRNRLIKMYRVRTLAGSCGLM